MTSPVPPLTAEIPSPLTSYPTTDPRWTEAGTPSGLATAAAGLLRDKRDVTFVQVCTRILLTLVPCAVLLYTLPVPWVLGLAPFYYGLWVFWLPRYILMLHAVCHRPIFPKERGWMNHIIPWFFGPFFGQTPTSFYAHHVGMHHVEDNLEGDLSSTQCYQRDRFAHWLRYMGRFFLLGTVQLYRYLVRSKRAKLGRQLVIGEVSWLAFVLAMSWVSPVATLVVFVFPLLIIRVLFMAGNWGQHAFVDPRDPANPYTHSTTLTNVPYNHFAYNDGFHVVHHLKPNLHWTDMATEFEKNVPEYTKQDAVVFTGMADNQRVWWLLMTRNYDELARHIVPLRPRTHAETVAWLQSRIQEPVGRMPGMLEIG